MTVILRLPDPAALTWERRADLRDMVATAVRGALRSSAPVAVDILPDEPPQPR